MSEDELELQVRWRADQELVEIEETGKKEEEVSEPARPPRQSYFKRLRRVRAKGAILILVLNALVDVSYFGALGQMFNVLLTENQVEPPGFAYFVQVTFTLALPQMLYPVAGWLADAYLGRYRTIHASLWFLWVGFMLLFISVSTELAHGGWVRALAFYFVFPIAFLCINCGLAGFHANVIPFGLDQMPSASAKEISAFIHWYYWTRAIGTGVVITILSCTTLDKYIVLTQSLIELVCTTVALELFYHLKEWMIIEPQSENPFRTVYGVLRFAAKHKNPLNRSALTYWEQKLPSRINLAKDKYGGPYSSESVENVKSFLNISMVLLALGGYIVVYYEVRQRANFGVYTILLCPTLHAPQDYFPFLSHLKDNDIFGKRCTASELLTGSLIPLAILICLPLYEVIYPFVFEYVPTSLRRIGVGIAVGCVAISSVIAIDVTGHKLEGSSSSMCFLINDTSVPIDVPVYWITIPSLLSALAEMLVFISGM